MGSIDGSEEEFRLLDDCKSTIVSLGCIRIRVGQMIDSFRVA